MKKLLLCMALLFSTVLSAMGEIMTIYKYEFNESTKTLSDPIAEKVDASLIGATGGEVSLLLGYYYVDANKTLTIVNVQNLPGETVSLIIKEGVTLNLTGIRIDAGSKLAIYTTTTDPAKVGKIIVNQTHNGCAAIGGWEERMMGELIVHGVNITATGGKRGAGIGSGGMTSGQSVGIDESSGKVTIYNGTIVANGGQYAAGIGGGAGYGQYGKCGVDYIQYGGKVTANGGELAAGVGGGGSYASYSKNINQRGGSVGHVTVYGGTLEATGGRRGAGIGSGSTGTSYTSGINVNGFVHIYGGTVTANGGEYAAGIGGGCNARGAVVTIYDGNVNAYGGEDAAGIGGGEDGEGYIFTMEKGTLNVTGKGKGAAIGGGQNALGGMITIKSGTVEAKAGNLCGRVDPQSGGVFGSGCGASTRDNTSGHILTLGDGLKARANRLYTASYECAPDARVVACRTQYQVSLSNCTHQEKKEVGLSIEIVPAIKYETTATDHTGHCKFCAYTIEKESHDGATCSVCGYKSDKSNVAIIKLRWAESAGEGYMKSDQIQMVASTGKYFLPFKEPLDGYEFLGWLKTSTDTSPGDVEMIDGETILKPADEVTFASGDSYYYARYRRQYHTDWQWQETDDHVTNKPKLTIYDVTAGEESTPIVVPEANITVTKTESGGTTTVKATATYTRTEDGKNYTYTFTENLEFMTVDEIWIRDDDSDTSSEPDNEEKLFTNNGDYVKKVHMLGRNILGNGKWNTMCLPFDVNDASLTLFEDIEEIRGLSKSSYDKSSGTLTLSFEDLVGKKIPAGTPFLIKTKAGSKDHYSPLFTNKTLSRKYNDVETEHVVFIGTYSTITLEKYDDVYFLGNDNKLYYPDADVKVNACRGYFQLTDLSVDDGLSSGARSIVLDFGDGETTAINLVPVSGDTTTAKGWYTIDGKQLPGKPTIHGLYIHQGKKYVVK